MNGAARIFLYNWPAFVATWLASLVAIAADVALASQLPPFAVFVVVVAATGAIAWSLFALWVSHYVYDTSPLSRGAWLTELLPTPTSTWASVDAGLDGEVALDDAIPGVCLARVDIYDGAVVKAPSVARARKLTARKHANAIAARADALPLADGACDVVAIVFSAHEIRDDAMGARFFAEVSRGLRPGGRAIVVEHVRDVASFIAFGPGFLHFRSRRHWLDLAADAGFVVARELTVATWVKAFAFEKPR